MFRPLKNFYFLSLKSHRVSRPEKWMVFKRCEVNFYSSHREKILNLVLKQKDLKDWEEVVRNVQSLAKSTLIGGEILVFNCCEANQLHEKAMSFLKYLLQNSRLSRSSLQKFMSLVEKYPNSYLPCRRLIYNLFVILLELDPIRAQWCASAFFRYPGNVDEMFNIYMNNLGKFPCHSIIVESLASSNRVEETIKLYLSSPFHVNIWETVMEVVRDELENSRMPYKLNEVLLKAIQEVIVCNTFQKYSLTLSDILKLANKIDRDYSWKMTLFPCKKHKCHSCGQNLERSYVTGQEMSSLLDVFEDRVVKKNVFIANFQEQWADFCIFLDKIEYDVVLDGLNMLFGVNFKVKQVRNVIDTVLQYRTNLLIIARRHVKPFFRTLSLPRNCSIFYLNNWENDDIYILYAAMKKGPNCWLFSHDKFSYFKVQCSLKDTHRDVYERWEMSHVGRYVKSRVILPLNLKLGMKIENCSDPSEFIWHVTLINAQDYPLVGCISKRKRLEKYRGMFVEEKEEEQLSEKRGRSVRGEKEKGLSEIGGMFVEEKKEEQLGKYRGMFVEEKEEEQLSEKHGRSVRGEKEKGLSENGGMFVEEEKEEQLGKYRGMFVEEKKEEQLSKKRGRSVGEKEKGLSENGGMFVEEKKEEQSSEKRVRSVRGEKEKGLSENGGMFVEEKKKKKKSSKISIN